jgi:hypothetical protein
MTITNIWPPNSRALMAMAENSQILPPIVCVSPIHFIDRVSKPQVELSPHNTGSQWITSPLV